MAFNAVVDGNHVVIDLTDTTAPSLPINGNGAGLVSSYHIEQGEDGHLRVILETKTPALIHWSTIKPAIESQPAQLTLELAANDSLPPLVDPEPALQTGSVSAAPLAQQSAPPKPKFTIAIDPGHGGMDPGAIGHDHVREKDVVLAFGLALKEALETTGQYNVVMSRHDDSFIALPDRPKLAQEARADLFIAIHADTLDDPSVRGTTIYTLSDRASDNEAEALAQKENRADIITGMDLGKQKAEVANVLINLAQRESKSQALMFAKAAVNEIRPVTELTGKPMRSAAFVVLKAPDVPSVLVELGYLSNAADRGMLVSTKWRKDMALALTRAVEHHFAPMATAAKQ